MEYCCDGVLDAFPNPIHYSTTPTLHFSTCALPNIHPLIGRSHHWCAIRNFERFLELNQVRQWPDRAETAG